MNAAGLRLSVFFGDSLTLDGRLAADVLLGVFADHEVTAAALFRGLEGFGAGRRLHLASFPDVSTDLPLVATAVAERPRIEAMLGEVDRVVGRGLVTLEHVRLLTGEDVAEAAAGPEAGGAVRLTCYCGRGERVGTAPAYRALVSLLQRHGAPGATVLLGVDGLYHGLRARARLFARNDDVPMAVVALAPTPVLARVLPLVGQLLARPLVTLEPIALVKHQGRALDPLPAFASGDRPGAEAWQSLEIYTRRFTQADGRPLHAELVRRLRRAGAAGATTVPGEWGFSSEETPHGERLWASVSHVPTCTRVIDRSEAVQAYWPLVDELTAEFGTVASGFVAAYREQAARRHDDPHRLVHDRLDLAEEIPRGPRPVPLSAGAPVAPGGRPGPEAAGATAPGGAGAGDTEEDRFVRTLVEQAAAFARARGRPHAAVLVHLADGEQFLLAGLDALPGTGLVAFYPHPERHDELLAGLEGRGSLPRAVLAPLHAVTKIELLPVTPRGTRSLAVFAPEPPRGAAPGDGEPDGPRGAAGDAGTRGVPPRAP